MLFNDGPNNDNVAINLNGTTTNLTSWETYYPSVNQSSPAIDSVSFRVATGCSVLGTCANVNGNGVYFDNFSQSSSASAVPVPATLALFMLGLAAVCFTRNTKA